MYETTYKASKLYETMGLADHRFFLPITRELVRGSKEPAPDLFRRLGIPKATGYKVLRFYTFHGAATTTRSAIVADAQEVIRLAGALRMDRAVPDHTLTHSMGPEALAAALAKNDVPYALGFQTAANRIGYFEPSPAVDLYVAREHQETVRDLVAGHKNAGETRLHYEPMERLEVMDDGDGVRITSPIQTILDLATASHGSAHQAFLMDVVRIGARRHG
jgi:hypothetical protein